MENKTEWDQAYYGIGQGDKNDVAQILRSAHRELSQYKDLHITDIYLRQAMDAEEGPVLFVQYWMGEDSEETTDKLVAPELDTIAYFPTKKQEASLQRLIFQLKAGMSQANVVELLRLTSDFLIDQKLNFNVEEIILHDLLDDDGKDHPRLRVYIS